MVEEGYSMYCTNCGEQLQENARFCGNCGAEIQSSSPVVEGKQASTPSSGGSRLGKVLILCVLAVAFIGVAVLGKTVLRGDFGFLASKEPPDPAFSRLLPVLRDRTEAPIMLPSSLPPELKDVAIDRNLEGESYSILFKAGPPEGVLDDYIRVETPGTLTAIPSSQVEETNDSYTATSSDTILLSDGTEARLRYMEPLGQVVNYGPYWEGNFEKDGYTYTLSVYLGQNGDEITRQVLSSIVSVPPDTE